jgi:adenine-specific DNA-methyltransferase
MPPKSKSPIPVTAVKHKDKRTNIPTKELRGFVEEDEKQPKTVLYPRDTSLDPQLVWKGKDEQDRKPLEVPAVPIYIQEKIHPQAIIENVRAEAKKGQPQQVEIFSDFNGIKFEELIDFYHHEQNWSNRFILGDSLLVMTSLAEKEGLKGKVQCLYFDPPYGINFGSNWQVSTRKRDVKDGKAEDATRQPEQIRAFRDTWKLGIHSYLAYLRDRLTAARELLTESGSVFVQISDVNVHLVRSVMDEVFGSENFCRIIPFAKTASTATNLLSEEFDYLIWYAKRIETVKYRQLHLEKIVGTFKSYKYAESPDGTEIRPLTNDELADPKLIPPQWRVLQVSNLASQDPGKPEERKYQLDEISYDCGASKHWKTTNPEGLNRLRDARRLLGLASQLNFKRYLDDFPATPLTNVWSDTGSAGYSATDPKVYVVQTDSKVIERCMLMTTDPGDLVLDPTCGSGTTAFVAEQWGRRWITIDTSRVAIALARTRLMAAKFPYYLLADSLEGVRKEAELTGKTPPDYKTENDIKKGFVYERIPHVTLKSIANNPDIKPGMSRAEIDAAIRRHANTEFLYDNPYQDNKRIRVTGPFTVESLSPHRVLATDEDRPATETEGKEQSATGQFTTLIVENLKTAGVQNTRKGERLKFDTLESFAGTWLHATGTYTESGKSRRVAISIGPEHGTVGPEQVNEAAKEAVQGVGFDLLIVCGFAFDPHVTEEAKRYGKLQVVIARMNPDLAMGDELLKKTGAGNLFMVFGELDMDVKKQKDGNLVVTIKGVDVYDPTTGQIRNSSTDDIACWFIDTDYNGESFFVRQAYFTGADEPYEKLKRALRAEIDEAAWQTLYSTTSRPFPSPKNKKIAVKVINHYGDEVLKVCAV